MRLHSKLACAVILLTVAGCAKEDKQRAPAIGESCEGMEFCTEHQGNGGGILPGSGGGNTQQDAGATNAAPDAGLGSLAGSIAVVSAPIPGTDLTQATALDFGKVEVAAPGSSGDRVSVTSDGHFILPGVTVTPLLWVTLRQTQGASTQQLMTTIQQVDSTKPSTGALRIADRASVESLAAVGALGTPTELDPDRAHAILHFVDGHDAARPPLSGVKVLVNAALVGAVVAYDAGNSFSDALESTDLQGAVLLLNMSAEIFPGAAKGLVFNAGGNDQTVEIEAARNCITLATIIVN